MSSEVHQFGGRKGDLFKGTILMMLAAFLRVSAGSDADTRKFRVRVDGKEK